MVIAFMLAALRFDGNKLKERSFYMERSFVVWQYGFQRYRWSG
ncbi:hypothetical protein CHCC20333_4762 [Bacillus paralicheniformis]|nr:hypothetical protein CHCC20333_4762 [Bacillus paralicheniformis]